MNDGIRPLGSDEIVHGGCVGDIEFGKIGSHCLMSAHSELLNEIGTQLPA